MSEHEPSSPSDPAVPPSAEAPAWGQSYLNQPTNVGEGEPNLQPPGVPGYSGQTPTGGTGSSSTSGASQTRYRGPKPIRAPRFSGMPLIAGLGMLGLLLSVAVMAILFGKVFDGMSPATRSVIGATSVPELPGQTGNPAQPGVQPSSNARAAMCASDREVVETAGRAYELLNGFPPADQQVLVDEDFLKEVVPGVEVVPSGDSFVVNLVGECA